MENIIKLKVKLTPEDMKAYSSAIIKERKTSNIILIISLLMIIPLDIFNINAVLAAKSNSEAAQLIVYALSVNVFIIAINVLPGYSIRLANKKNYNKSKLIQNARTYEFTDNKIIVSSSNGISNIEWDTIYKIVELKPCFQIFTSYGIASVLPKRCFNNAEQIKKLISLLYDKVPVQKLKLKNYDNNNIVFSPETANEAYEEEAVKPENEISEPESEAAKPKSEIAEAESEAVKPESEEGTEPLIEINFSFTKQELIEINFRYCYKNPFAIILTFLGVILTCIGLNAFVNGVGGSASPIITGILFIIVVPIVVIYSSNKTYQSNKVARNTITYKFYKEYFTVDSMSTLNKIKWDELVKIVEFKSSFMFFISKRSFYFILKRAFKNKEELNLLLDIMNKNREN